MIMNNKKVLITGYGGFTGKLLGERLSKCGYKIFGLTVNEPNFDFEYKIDMTHYDQLCQVVTKIRPDYVIHLAAISAVTHQNLELFYRVNLFGTLNLLEALAEARVEPQKIVIASSAYVYGNTLEAKIAETVVPQPINHYGASKLAMEHMVATWFERFPIIITRPFNYTGRGQEPTFLIPKIVRAFREKSLSLELGDITVVRDISDVNFVLDVYSRLLESNIHSEIFNICSEEGYAVKDILAMMNEISGHDLKIKFNPSFSRKNDIPQLVGSNKKLFASLGEIPIIALNETLKIMYLSK